MAIPKCSSLDFRAVLGLTIGLFLFGCAKSLWGAGLTESDLKDSNGAPVRFLSPVVDASTPGHAIDIDLDIRKARKLVLIVADGNGSTACDHADWMEPRLMGSAGEIKLTDLEWRIAHNGWHSAAKNANVQGQPLLVDGKPVPFGIGAHSPSILVFDLPAGSDRFRARAGLDDGGLLHTQNAGDASVQFVILTDMPSPKQLAALGLTARFNYFRKQDLEDPAGAQVRYLSDWVSRLTPGHQVDIDADISGAESLFLVVSSGGDIGCDHADWLAPRLTGPAGELRLTSQAWDYALSGWKSVVTNKSITGKPMKVMGTNVAEDGIGTHATSIIKYKIPKGYSQFKAQVALDDSGVSQSSDLEMAAVQFAVLTGKLSRRQIRQLGLAGSFVRFRVDALPEGKQELAITGHLKFHSAPWQTKEFPLVPSPVKAPGLTPWINLESLPGGANGPLLLTIPAGAKGITQFSVLEDDAGVVREIAWDEPNGKQLIVTPGFREVLTFRDQERRYYLNAAAIRPGRLFPLTRPPLLFANAWGWATDGAAEYMVKSFRLLGLNSVATSEDTEKYEALYGWGSQGGHYAPPTFIPYDIEKSRQSYRDHYARYFASEAGKKTSPGMVSFQMSDEPGEIAVKGPDAEAGFQAWLQQQGLKPALFGKDQWNQVTFFTGKPVTADDQRRFYWSRRYQGMITPLMFGLACDGFDEASPAQQAKPFVALSGHSLNFGNKLPLDMFQLAQYPHLEPGISDWMTGGSWCWDSHQSVAFSVAPYNAGARRYGKEFGQPPISFPMMHCVWPSFFRAYTQIANQCKLLSYYNYGPDYAVTEGFWSSSDWSRTVVHHVDNLAAQVDDILGPGRMRPSRVALLYAMSTEYRWPQSTFPDKRATFLALSHEYYQPELVTEQQIESGALEHYDALLIEDQWITVAAQKTIAEWVRNGGQLQAYADAGVRNEYDEPCDLMNSLAGFQRTFGAAVTGQTLNVSAVTNEAEMIPHTVPTEGRPQTITVGKARVRARYGDDQPAWTEKTVGRGKVVYVGHRAGLSYSRRAVKKRDLSLWPDSGREFLVQPLLEAHVPRELELSQPFVMAMPLSTEAGTVVVLYNMTGQVASNLTVRLREPQRPVSVQGFNPETLAPTNQSFEYAAGWVSIPIDFLPWNGTMLCVRRQAAPADDRLDRMRKAAGQQLDSSDWQALSAGAWTAGFFPDWDLAGRLIPLLKHDHWAVRRSAAESLGRLKAKTAIKALRAALETETDDHARADELMALARIRAPDVRQLAEKFADYPNPVVQAACQSIQALIKADAAQMTLP
jgi:hypothetical protein